MKVRVKKEEEKFNPIELTITIESLDEVRALWAALNASPKALQGSGVMVNYKLSCNRYNYEAWKVVDEIAAELGIKNE